ncbi:ParA family protein [Thermosulfuriphilus sp.]
MVFSNRKGGVGKTTSAVNVAAALALMGQRVLLVDADSQGHASIFLGIRPAARPDLVDFLLNGAGSPLEARENLALIPASGRLSEYELRALKAPRELLRLKRVLEELEKDFDFIIIDSPPNLGVLTLSALLATQAVICPLPLNFLALKGLAETKTLVDKVKGNNPSLCLRGILPTFFNLKLRHARAVLEEIRRVFGEKILLPPVRNSIRAAEAPSFGKTIFEYAPGSPVAEDYRRVAESILEGFNV